MYFVYDAAGRPIEVSYTPAGSTTVGFYYFVTNLQGDVIAILNSSGYPVVEYTYDAWGKILSITGSMASTLGVQNPLRYRGYVYDQETNLYYLQSRYYDPEIGRFINADALVSTGQGLLGNNMFAYCGNNPVKNVDYFGYFETCYLDDPMNVNRAFITPAIFVGGSGYVADVRSSYYAQQNVRTYDSYWRNSCYNVTATGPVSSVNQSVASGGNYQSPIPYPGNDPTRCDVLGFSWRGSGDPGSNKGNFYNLQTGEWLHPDLFHPMPIGPHWDYGRRGSSEVYRVFPDGRMKLK